MNWARLGTMSKSPESAPMSQIYASFWILETRWTSHLMTGFSLRMEPGNDVGDLGIARAAEPHEIAKSVAFSVEVHANVKIGK